MKIFSLLLTFLIAGCAPSPGTHPRAKTGSADKALRPALALRFRYHHVRRGDSLLYLLRKPKGNKEMTKISAVGEAGTRLWIEEKILSSASTGNKPWIRKSLIDREGMPAEIWRGQPFGNAPVRLWPPPRETSDLPPGIVRPSPQEDGAPTTAPRGELPPLIFQEIQKDEQTRGADRIFRCTLVTWTIARPGKADLVGMDWLSSDVPFDIHYPWGETYGGLVRRVVIPRRGEEYTIELVSMGSEAREELPLN